MADAVSLEGLEFEISAVTSKAIQNVNNLSESLKNLKSAVETNINSSIESFKKLNKAISAVSTNNPIHKLAKSLENISGLSKLSNIKVPENIGKSIVDSFNSFDPEKIKEISEKTNKALGEINFDNLKKATSTIRAFNKAISSTVESNVATTIKDIAIAISEIGDKPSYLGKLVNQIKALSKIGGIDITIATSIRAIASAIKKADEVNTFQILNLINVLGNMKNNPAAASLAGYITQLSNAITAYPFDMSTQVVNKLKEFEFTGDFKSISRLSYNFLTLFQYVSALNSALEKASSGGLQVFENSAAGISKLNSAISSLDENALNNKITAVDKVFQREFSQKLANSVQGFPDIKLSSIADALGKMKGLDLYISETFVDNLSLLSGVMRDEWAEGDIAKLHSIAEAFPAFKGISDIKLPKGFTTFLSNLSDKLKNFDATNLPALSKVAEALRGFIGLDDIKISSSFANQISKISDALKKLTEDDINKLRELADAVKKIGEVGDKSLKLKINTSDIEKSKKSIKSANDDALKNLKLFAAGLGNIFLSPIKGAFQIVAQLFSPLTGKILEKFSDIKSKVTEALEPIKEKVSEALEPIKEKVSEALASLAPYAKIIKNTIIAPLKGVIQVAQSVSGVLKTAFISPLKYAGKLSVAIGKSILSPIQKVASRLKVVIAGFGKIIKLRAFRFIITSITGGIKEGTDNLYQFSKGINGEFAKSMDTLATSMLYFKNSVGAAIAPVINQLAPAIDILVDKIVDGTNKINQFLAQMTGATYWTKAVKYPKEYAEAVDDAKKSVQDFTMGFDELNIISDNSSSKSSDNLDYSKMFEIVDLQKNPWTEQLKNAIENGDWYGAGNLLGEKFNSVFQNIDYSGAGAELGTKINNAISLAKGFLDVSDFETVGTGIASFLNSGFEQIDFYNLGSVLAGKWNILIDTVHGFVTEFKFAEFGKDLSDAVNGWFDTIDLNKAAQDIQLGLEGILDTAYEFLTNVDFRGIGEKIGDALNQFDLPTILGKFAQTASEFAIGVFNTLSGFLQDVDWQKLGSDIFYSVSEIIKNIDWAGVTSSFAEFLGSAIGAVGGLLWGIIKPLINVGWNLGEKFYDKFTEDGKFSWKGFLEGIKEAITRIGTWIKTNILNPFMKGFKKAFGIHSPSTVMAEQGEFIIAGLKNGIINMLSGIKNWIKEHIFQPFLDKFEEFKDNWQAGWNEIKNKFSDFKSNLVSVAKTLKNNLSKTWDSIKSKVSDTLEPLFDTAKSNFDNFKSNWIDGAETIKNTLSEKWDSIKSKVSETVNPLFDSAKSNFNDFKKVWTDGTATIKEKTYETWDLLKEKVSNTINPMWDTAKSNFSSFKSDWLSGWEDIKTGLSTKWSEIKNDASNVFSPIETSFKNGANAIIGFIEGMVNNVIFAFNEMGRVLNSFSFDIPDWVPGIGGGSFSLNLPEWSEISLTRFDKGGFPSSGDLFFANENGRPEFVGSMGGRTAVANNDQIVEGIYSAVYSAMMAVMSSENGRNGTPEINVYLDSKQITAKVEERKLARGQQIFTGGVVSEY